MLSAGILIVGLIVAVGLGAYCLWFVVTAVGLAETFDGRHEKPGGEAGTRPTVELTHTQSRPSSHCGLEAVTP